MDDPVKVPFGFWLRTVDSLIDASMNDLFESRGITRRLWQVLSTVKRNEPATEPSISQAMTMFLDGDSPDATQLLGELARLGWAASSDGTWVLTEAGRSTVSELEAEVALHRTSMFRDVSDASYRTTVETLARITTNLDPEGTRAARFR